MKALKKTAQLNKKEAGLFGDSAYDHYMNDEWELGDAKQKGGSSSSAYDHYMKGDWDAGDAQYKKEGLPEVGSSSTPSAGSSSTPSAGSSSGSSDYGVKGPGPRKGPDRMKPSTPKSTPDPGWSDKVKGWADKAKKNPGKALGGAALGAGALYGGKKLYDHFSGDDESGGQNESIALPQGRQGIPKRSQLDTNPLRKSAMAQRGRMHRLSGGDGERGDDVFHQFRVERDL